MLTARIRCHPEATAEVDAAQLLCRVMYCLCLEAVSKRLLAKGGLGSSLPADPRSHPLWVLKLLLVTSCAWTTAALAQPTDTIFDEARVPAYVLPDPLIMQDGTRVTTAADWTARRRPEIVRLFEDHVFGRGPQAPTQVPFEVTSSDDRALGGAATRKQVTVYVNGRRDGPSIDLLLYVPNATAKPVPVFLGLNFYGNHTIDSDPDIKLSTTPGQWRNRFVQHAGIGLPCEPCSRTMRAA